MRKDLLHESLPDVTSYLERIGIQGRPEPTLENLDLLIQSHHFAIPFEDIDVHIHHRQPDLAIPSLFDKIVTRRRGGYCFEMNGLFTQLLEELGYDVRSVFCRPWIPDGTVHPCLHRAFVVRISGAFYFGDVGFGGAMPPGALKVEDGQERTILGEHFGVCRDDEYWWRVYRTNSAGETENVMEFNLFPQTRSEFLPANAFCSAPGSYFSESLLLNLKTKKGHVSITDRVFRIEEDGKCTDEIIQDDSRLKEILETYFGIRNAL